MKEKNYSLEIQPGRIVKETYHVEFEKIASAQAPTVSGEFQAPYVAQVTLPLGDESVKVNGEFGDFDAQYRLKGNTAVKRFGNLLQLLCKIAVSETGAIFSNTNKSVVQYEGLPKEAMQAVDKAKEDYHHALQAYVNVLDSPKKVTTLHKRQVINVFPNGFCRQTNTLDDKL